VKASIIVVGVAAAVLAGCGSIGSSAGASGGAAAAKTSPSPGRAGLGNGVVGQVSQVASGKLTVDDQSGSVTVTYDSSTSVLQSGSGTLTEAIPGTCVVATGTTDASGTVTARTFQVQLNMGGNCTPPAGLGGGQGAGGGSPRPGRGSPSPGAGGGPPANFANVRGKLTNVSGSTMTVQPQTGNPVTVVVSSTTTVTRLVTSSSARLAVGECVSANGQRDSSGTVKARSILISAPGPNGCTRAGGFGGGGRPGASPSSQGA
jgi:Domain of unknown function (DUF5666)